MEKFVDFLAPILAATIGIMILAIFFKILNRMGKSQDEPPLIKLKGFFKDAEFVDVHLNGSKVLEKVKLIGVSDATNVGKGGFPYELNGMVILEKENKQKIMIKAKSINMIIETEQK